MNRERLAALRRVARVYACRHAGSLKKVTAIRVTEWPPDAGSPDHRITFLGPRGKPVAVLKVPAVTSLASLYKTMDKMLAELNRKEPHGQP